MHAFFANITHIPYLYQILIRALVCKDGYKHCSGITEFEETIRKYTPGVMLPAKGIHYLRMIYFKNQRIRWAFKKLYHKWLCNRMSKYVYNTECLYGAPIAYKPSLRRILHLWDVTSKRVYLFRIENVLHMLRSKILGEEIHTLKNPYTNIPFTVAQIRRIYCFLQENRDKVSPDDEPILTYLRWQDKGLTYAHITHNSYTHFIPIDYGWVNDHETPWIAKILWDNTMNESCIAPGKREQYIEMRNEFFSHIWYRHDTQLTYIPTTKLGYYVYSKIMNTNIDIMDTLVLWKRSNRARYSIRNVSE